MVHTEQLAPDTIIFHVDGIIDKDVARELGFSVFRSYQLGFKTYFLNLCEVSCIQPEASQNLRLIEEGIRGKGGTLKIIAPPSLCLNPEMFKMSLSAVPPQTWN